MTHTTADRANSVRATGEGRIRTLGDSTTRVVEEAAALLDEEVAAGIVAAKKMQQRFRAERRVDSADFKDALQRFQSDGHQLIDQLNRQFVEMQSAESAELRARLIQRTHDMLDLMVGFVDTGAEVANPLIEVTERATKSDATKSDATKSDATTTRSRKSGAVKTRPQRGR